MAMGANYAFELIFNETYAPQFNGHNKFFLASVLCYYNFKNPIVKMGVTNAKSLR